MEKRNVKMKEDTTGRLSELPECIIENILLRLDHPKERVRVSVLSKKWFALTASLPVLEFNINHFRRICSRDVVRDIFYKYIEHTVSRFCRQQNVMNAHTFKVRTTFQTIEEGKIVNECLDLILLKGVKALEIMIRGCTYHLPDRLTFASSLTSLKVSNCILPSSLMFNVANFKSLKALWLNGVHLDPLLIKHLMVSCPLLEELVVKFCKGFKKFCVEGRLQNLKKAHFIDNGGGIGFERIDIEAPNLCEFQLFVEERGAASVNLGLCKQLRTLCLRGTFFPTSTGLSEFLSNFPILENLSLGRFNRCNSLAFSSPSLRKFELCGKCDLENIDIITPNLLLFSYANKGNFINPKDIFKNDAGELNARMECHIIHDNDTLWFQQLRRFLEKYRFKNFNLQTNFCRKNISLYFEQLNVIQLPPYELEHLKLADWKTAELSFVDGILRCCCPRSVSLTSSFSSISNQRRSYILKYICGRLLQQEDNGSTNIRIEWSFPSKAKTYLSWNSMMLELPDHYKQTLTFIKEEGTCTHYKGLQMLRLCDPLN